jgi:hypothetical protein
VIMTRKTSPEKMLAILAPKTTRPVLLREMGELKSFAGSESSGLARSRLSVLP